MNADEMMIFIINEIDFELSQANWPAALDKCKQALDLSKQLTNSDPTYSIDLGINWDASRKLFKSAIMSNSENAIIISYLNEAKKTGQALLDKWSMRINQQQKIDITIELSVIDYFIKKATNNTNLRAFVVHPYPGQQEPGIVFDYKKYPDAPNPGMF
ncbi:MAG: hypothetical protein ACKO3K_02550 [Cuspidothrix sp.]|jgi:hypothetical protein